MKGYSFDLLVTVAEVIRDTPAGIPAGHLYAVLLDRLDHDGFERLIGTLCTAGLIRRDANYLLTWTGRGF